ncbi:MAG: hypothetical protein ACE5JG_05105 [Planctomycetota bacterium]
MRNAPGPVLLLLALPLLAQDDDEGEVLSNEELNFSMRTPNDDWVIMPGDPERQNYAYFLTEYAVDPSELEARGELRLQVLPLPRKWLKRSLASFAMEWKDVYEGHLANPRDRKETSGTLGGQESLTIDVTGDWGAGEGRRTYTLCKYGQHLYILMADRTFKAVRDEDLAEELDTIRKSFRFLREIKPGAAKGAKAVTPLVPGAEGDTPKPGSKEVDPALLKRKEIDGGFWRFKCVKPAGFLQQTVSAQEATQHKLKFAWVYHAKGGAQILIRLFADSTKSKQQTIKQWAKSIEKQFVQGYKDHQPAEVDDKFKMARAKDAIRLILVGRKGQVVHFEWLLIEGRNDRQYRIMIMSTASAHRTFKRQIDEFRSSFKLLAR